jgi:dipeptidase
MTDLPEKMQTAERKFDKDSLWWQLKRLALLVSIDEERFGADIRREIASIERCFEDLATKGEELAKKLVKDGQPEDAREVLETVTESCTERLYYIARQEADKIAEAIKSSGGLYGRQKETIEKYIEYSEIELL